MLEIMCPIEKCANLSLRKFWVKPIVGCANLMIYQLGDVAIDVVPIK